MSSILNLCMLGGSKKSLRKRWFVLSSRFFFYFEKEEVSCSHIAMYMHASDPISLMEDDYAATCGA